MCRRGHLIGMVHVPAWSEGLAPNSYFGRFSILTPGGKAGPVGNAMFESYEAILEYSNTRPIDPAFKP